MTGGSAYTVSATEHRVEVVRACREDDLMSAYPFIADPDVDVREGPAVEEPGQVSLPRYRHMNVG